MERCKRDGESMNNQGVVNEDRISDLPEALILQILSLLPTDYAVATSVLSKQWQSHWKMLPKLKFDSFYPKHGLGTFSKNVCKCLLSHKAPVLQSFHLRICLERCNAMDTGILIGLAISRNMRKLVLEVKVNYREWFRFPKSLLYSCETLDTLELKYSVFMDVPSSVCLKSLRTLHLDHVDFKDSESVSNLLSGCPNLENLVVHRYRFGSTVKTFTIEVPSLQRLEIYDFNNTREFEGYVINAPSLKYLRIEGILNNVYCLIENTPKLVEASIIVAETLVLNAYPGKSYSFATSLYNFESLETLKLSHCILVHVPSPVCLKSLKTLRLYRVGYNDNQSFLNLLSGCISLENLEIHQFKSFNVKTCTIAVPSLKRLTLTFADDDEAYSVSVINAHSLKYLLIVGILGDGSCLIENTPDQLMEASIIDVSSLVFESILGSLSSVKRLSLKIESPLGGIKFPSGSIFYQLVYLELHTHEVEWWNLLTLMLDSSPNLQVLKLIGAWFKKIDRVAYSKWIQPKNVPECLLLHLETLVWTDYEGVLEDEKEVVKYILSNASCLKKATFSTFLCPEERLERLVELKNVVMASSSCQLVFKEADN